MGEAIGSVALLPTYEMVPACAHAVAGDCRGARCPCAAHRRRLLLSTPVHMPVPAHGPQLMLSPGSPSPCRQWARASRKALAIA